MIGSSGAQPGYAIKLVLAKEAPSTVVGDDDSLCRLTAERYDRVDVGDWLACEWTIAPETTASIEPGRRLLRLMRLRTMNLYVEPPSL